MSKENTKTEIVNTEQVFLGREHVRFLDDIIGQLKSMNNYKVTKSQIMRVLIECAMRRPLELSEISNEDELRQALGVEDGEEATRIRKND
jgi:hypothetical protein